jgi:hypothetical protein
MIMLAVHRRRQPHDRGAHTARTERQRRFRGSGKGWVSRVLLGEETSRRETGHPRGDDEGSVGSRERLADGLDGVPIGLGRSRVVVEVVNERQVDDSVGGRGPCAQAGEVIEMTPMDVSSGSRESLG